MARVDVVQVHSDSTCPSAAAIEAQVRELTTPEQRAAVPEDSLVVVTDRGSVVSITLTRDGKTTQRLYRDEARDCERRAHFISVLVVVTLMPPDFSEPSRESSPREPERIPTPPREERGVQSEPTQPESPRVERRVSQVRIELAARAEASTPIADSARIASTGAALGVALGAGRLRLSLATGYAPSTELQLTGNAPGRASAERLDFGVGLRWVLTRRPLAVSVDGSALGVRTAVTGLSSSKPSGDTAFDLGARVGLHVSWSDETLLSPFITGYASVFPAAPSLTELPQGNVGHLPYLWLGLSAGLALGL